MYIYIYIYINMFLDLGDCFFRFLEVFSSKREGWRGGGGDCRKHGTFEGRMKEETLANFFQ